MFITSTMGAFRQRYYTPVAQFSSVNLLYNSTCILKHMADSIHFLQRIDSESNRFFTMNQLRARVHSGVVRDLGNLSQLSSVSAHTRVL